MEVTIIFFTFFCQAQLESHKNYSVILFSPENDPEVSKNIDNLRQTKIGGHEMKLKHR
jgi:hypothetical protein